MNELLQKHGCSNVFTVPEGLKELMSDITREVLRWQPPKILDFIANYLSALLITREHGIMAVKILDDLCDCRPTLEEHLLQIGIERPDAEDLATIIKDEIEMLRPEDGKEKVRETAILKKVLHRYPMDEEMTEKVCQITRNAYRDYWYRKNLINKGIQGQQPDAPWEKAAQHTLEIYKKTKPSISELHRATEKIQAAYRGYHVRRNVLRHLEDEPKKKKYTRKVEMPGPPLDIAGSREMDLGPVIKIKVRDDNVGGMFEKEEEAKLGFKYDPTKTITHREDNEFLQEKRSANKINLNVEQMKSPKFSVIAVALSKPSLAPGQGFTLISEMERSKAMPIPSDYPIGHPKISFADAPTMIIKTLEDEACEVPEIPGIGVQIVEPLVLPPGAFEIPEELADDSNFPSARTVEEENE